MRSVAGWIGALWLVTGCTVPSDVARTCSTDADCGQGGSCDLRVGLCYAAGTEPEVPSCTLNCTAYEACTATRCMPRFTDLKILSPAANTLVAGGTVEVQAQLKADPTYASTTTYPDTLLFSTTRNDSNGDVGSFGAVTRTGDTYTVQWTPPSGQTQVTLSASHPIPAAVQKASVTIQLDTVAPTFTITFSNPPTRATGTVATQADERDPTSGFDTAFRRDESVTVTVSADEAVSGVTLTVVGIGAGGNPGQEQPPVVVQPGGTCGGSPPFCGTATVDLSTPEMKDVRGTIEFRVAGQDASGNKGSTNSGLKVTRWKWVFDAGLAISGNPAVGNRGTLYFGTNTNAATGKTLAVGANGSKKWEASTGDVLGNVAVGALASNEEYVYVAGKSGSGSYLYALAGSSGAEKHHCGPYANAVQLQGSLAVGAVTFGSDTAETASGIYETTGNLTRIAGIRPDGVYKCFDTSNSASPVPISVAGGSYVMKDQNIFYGTNGDNPGTQVTSYDLGTGSNSPRASWPVDPVDLARGLALEGNKLYIASSGSSSSNGEISSVQVTGGALTKVYPASGGSRVYNLAIGSGNTAYFGAETSSATELVVLALDTGSPVRASAGTLRGAPIVGTNNRIYTLDTQGKVTVWALSPLAPIWSVNLALALSSKDVSPTVDCRRDGSGTAVPGPGTLYVAGDKRLYALITDGAGMDASAPWPKFQHDARNTGNPATPITNCP